MVAMVVVVVVVVFANVNVKDSALRGGLVVERRGGS